MRLDKRTKILISLVIGLFCFLGAGVGYLFFSTSPVPTYQEMRSGYVSSDLHLLDYQGAPLHQWRQNKKERSFSWIALKDISPTLITAILKSEDKNFFSHSGVDYFALLAGVYQQLVKNSSRGSSTISMQLIKLIAGKKNEYQGLFGKLRQIWSATLLETEWDKKQILEAYLNLVPFRGEYRGLTGISWTLFYKNPIGLTLSESTLLAVLIRSPNAKAADWAARACWQEAQLCKEFQSLTPALDQKITNILPNQHALHFAQRMNRDGYKGEVVTSVRKDLQLYVIEAVQSQIRGLENQNVHDAAVIVLENKTGEVWAYVGGSGLQTQNNYVDGVQAFRQAGSTLKPFLYATAFEKGLLNGASWIEDSAVDIVFDRGVYTPQNHDRQFYGWVQVKTALASSLNVPAVKIFKLLNDESFWNKLHELHFRNLKDPDHYGPALALGVADISLEDLTQAYRTLARKGLYSPLTFVASSQVKTSESQRVFTEKSAQDITQILSEGQNRALGFGLDSSLTLSGAAVKTGTSKDMRDNWCIGYNSKFTVGVWVGNFSGEPMWNVMGITGAAPIWKKVMEYLQEKYPVQEDASISERLVKSTSFKSSGVASSGNEDVKNKSPENREPEVVNLKMEKPEKYPQLRILYPQDGMVMALDPSIPAANQKMPLLVEGSRENKLFWKIDGKDIVSADGAHLWTPTLGYHRFELYQNKELTQSVQVLVK